jgi:O-antigen ligase
MLSPHRRFALARPAAPAVPPISPAVVATSPPATVTLGSPGAVRIAALEHNPLRRVAFWFGIALFFTELTVLQELAGQVLGFNPYILYILAPPAVLCGLFTGSVQRTFQHRAAWYWLGFYVWMIVATPFSQWRGGSIGRIIDGRINLIIIVVVGGLIVNWKEVRLVFYTIAAASIVNLLTARFFMDTSSGRLSLALDGFTIGNSNDLAAQLLLVLPFLLFIALDRRRNVALRCLPLAAIAYGLWVILGTASRGALIGLIGASLVLFVYGSARQRAAGVLAVLLGVALYMTLPGVTRSRLGTLVGERHEEAQESQAARNYLFLKSLSFTAEHPLFGVGPDQFANYEGGTSVAEGRVGSWHDTHCSWTQISSECGIPALVFYLAGVGSALLLVVRTFRAARRAGYTEIANACFCYLLGMAGFLVAITFLSNAYRYYVPAMIGLAVGMCFAARRQMDPAA